MVPINQEFLIETGEKEKFLEKNPLRDFFIDCLKDVYWAEKYLVKHFPKLTKAATNQSLSEIFSNHYRETVTQVERLEKVFELLHEKIQGKKCEAIAGIVKEAVQVVSERGSGTATLDAALIMAAQKIEHYEIASYGGLVQLARTLEEGKAAEIFEKILNEEKEADLLLTNIAEQTVNAQALIEEEELENSKKE